MAIIMKCGHVSDCHDRYGNPRCFQCHGTTPDAEIVDCERFGDDGLEGRTAKCIYRGHKEEKSKWELPFFEYRPNEEYDRYYCGCKGWD